jgi:hypothetical protein
MHTEFLEEPELEFGAGTHVDIRYGLATLGPLDRGDPTAPREIRVGLIGTSHTVEGVQRWLESCRCGVPAKQTRLVNLFPAFPGFSSDSPFGSTLTFHERWTSRLTDREASRKLPRQVDTRELEAPLVCLGRNMSGGTRPRLSCGRSWL